MVGGLKEPGYTAIVISTAPAGQGFQHTGVAAELHLDVSAEFRERGCPTFGLTVELREYLVVIPRLAVQALNSCSQCCLMPTNATTKARSRGRRAGFARVVLYFGRRSPNHEL